MIWCPAAVIGSGVFNLGSMDNTIFRTSGSDKSEIEFFVATTNELNPYREVKELGVVVIYGEFQFDFDFNEMEIDELIEYLQRIKAHVSEFNVNSKPVIE